MDIKAKKKVFDNILEYIKKEIPACDLELTKAALGYTITGYIFKGIDLEYSIRSKGDMAICKIYAAIKEDEDVSTDSIAKEIADPAKLNYTSYDGKYAFQSVVTFSKMTNQEAENKLMQCIKDILSLIKKNQDKFVLYF